MSKQDNRNGCIAMPFFILSVMGIFTGYGLSDQGNLLGDILTGISTFSAIICGVLIFNSIGSSNESEE